MFRIEGEVSGLTDLTGAVSNSLHGFHIHQKVWITTINILQIHTIYLTSIKRIAKIDSEGDLKILMIFSPYPEKGLDHNNNSNRYISLKTVG